jgi:hypothetical protein
MLFEIRNYYINPDQFEEYKEWAKVEALPYLSQKLDIVGAWVNTNDEPVITGEPVDKRGPANMTWIIKWRDMEHRNDEEHGASAVFSTPEFTEIFSRVPGGQASFLRTEVKFAESLM